MTAKEKDNYMSKLEGKVAVITGGNGGIGLAIAQQFVSADAYEWMSLIFCIHSLKLNLTL
jgi:FlaA1/EpsC-like NDP-sugar epimerase